MGRVRRKHPREFKIEAVRKLQSGEVTLSELARRINVSPRDLSEWREEVEAKGENVFPGHGKRVGQVAEIARLQRELERVKEERDVLKKAAAFLIRESK
jgi:transposase